MIRVSNFIVAFSNKADGLPFPKCSVINFNVLSSISIIVISWMCEYPLITGVLFLDRHAGSRDSDIVMC